MQKNHSQSETYVRGYLRNIKGSLLIAMIIIGVTVIIHLLGGCEQPSILQEIPLTDSLQRPNEDDINEWDMDTTIYNTTAKPER